jgi:hypothetical protein
MLCQQESALKMSASWPSWLLAFAAATMLCGSILLPMTPPVLLEVQISTSSEIMGSREREIRYACGPWSIDALSEPTLPRS